MERQAKRDRNGKARPLLGRGGDGTAGPTRQRRQRTAATWPGRGWNGWANATASGGARPLLCRGGDGIEALGHREPRRAAHRPEDGEGPAHDRALVDRRLGDVVGLLPVLQRVA